MIRSRTMVAFPSELQTPVIAGGRDELRTFFVIVDYHLACDVNDGV